MRGWENFRCGKLDLFWAYGLMTFKIFWLSLERLNELYGKSFRLVLRFPTIQYIWFIVKNPFKQWKVRNWRQFNVYNEGDPRQTPEKHQTSLLTQNLSAKLLKPNTSFQSTAKTAKITPHKSTLDWFSTDTVIVV